MYMKSPQGISKPLIYFMTLACGVVVASLYYCQPLLATFDDIFNVSETASSWINIFSQMGYGVGLFFIVPLGDRIDRKKLIIILMFCSVLSLLGMAMSNNIQTLYVFSLLVGITSTTGQIFVPLAAHLSSEKERGKVIGTLMGGLLTGILVSRTFSGFIADHLGWRAIYLIAAGGVLLLTYFSYRIIPSSPAAFSGKYSELMKSMWVMIKQQPMLRQSAWMGACLFGAISVFWSTMAFYLEAPPFSYSLSAIGLFGFVGATGAVVSPWAGRSSDRSGYKKPVMLGLVAMLSGFLVLFVSHQTILIFVIGIILIDMGLQLAHIPNLSIVNTLHAAARARLNTVYMTSFFIGGTLGSVIGSYAWQLYAWEGVCTMGLVLVVAGSMPLFFRSVRRRPT